MDSNMTMANLLADNVNSLIDLVRRHEKKQSFLLDQDKWYQVRLFLEDFRFHIVADELHRINTFCWNESYTKLLVTDVRKGLAVIDEFTERNYNDLFLLTAKLYTIKQLCQFFED